MHSATGHHPQHRGHCYYFFFRLLTKPLPVLPACQALATADEQAVARALAPAIAQQMRRRSSAGKLASGTAAASAANYAAAGMAARAAATLVQAARDHLCRQMQELASLAADIQEEEQAGAAAPAPAPAGQPYAAHAAAEPGPGVAARQPAAVQQQQQQQQQQQRAGQGEDLSPEELAQIQREVAQLGAGAAGGPGTPDKLAGVEVVVAPAAAQSWTQGVVK